MKPTSTPMLRFQGKERPSNPYLAARFHPGSEAVLLTLTYQRRGMGIERKVVDILDITGHHGKEVHGMGVPDSSDAGRVTVDEVDTVHFQTMDGKTDAIHYGDFQIEVGPEGQPPERTERFCLNKELTWGWPYNRRCEEEDSPHHLDPSVNVPQVPVAARFLFPRMEFRQKFDPLLEELTRRLKVVELESALEPPNPPDSLLFRQERLIHQFFKDVENFQD